MNLFDVVPQVAKLVGRELFVADVATERFVSVVGFVVDAKLVSVGKLFVA